jgi:hypothetical protein
VRSVQVRNYSKLSQEQTPLFCTHFLYIVRQVIDLFLVPPPEEALEEGSVHRRSNAPFVPSLLFWNTWGDGLFVVFSDPVQCSRFALVLLQKVEQTRWDLLGLPRELTMRVGMHAGPVLVGWDPVVRRNNFFGPHVLYAQLIEPITTPGCAFATAPFAACLATSAEAHEFRLEFVGSAALEEDTDDADYARLSNKEKQDYARCDLYNLKENRAYQERPAGESGDDAHASSTATGHPPASLMQTSSDAGGSSSALQSTSHVTTSSHPSSAARTRVGSEVSSPTSASSARRSSRPSSSGHSHGPSNSSSYNSTRVVHARIGSATAGRDLSAAAGPSSTAAASRPAVLPHSLTHSLLMHEERRTQQSNAMQAKEYAVAQQVAKQQHTDGKGGQAGAVRGRKGAAHAPEGLKRAK